MAGLSKKINHDQADDLGNTPLHYACRTAQIELIEALLAGKASKVANNSHLYPIHMAIESLSMPAVQLLKSTNSVIKMTYGFGTLCSIRSIVLLEWASSML